jgi:hypothetical protein
VALGKPVGRSVGRLCHWHLRIRGIGARTNSAGAILDGHKLHDDLQCAGSGLPDNLSRSRHAAGQRRDHHQQRDRKHGLSGQLLDAADLLSDDLRAILSVAVMASTQFGNRFRDRVDGFFRGRLTA